MQSWDTVAIIGVGLLGGSIGLALRKRKLAKNVVGIGRRRSSLAKAKELGCITQTSLTIRRGVAQAELVIVCTPVDLIALQAEEAAGFCASGAIITDVGSIKAQIVRAAEPTVLAASRGKAHFIGSHPIAGSEKTGPESARADLLHGRVVVMTPTARTDGAAYARLAALWEALGAKVLNLSPDEHDAALACTSHLPHLLAGALAVATPAERTRLCGNGWRDTTRIAAGDVDLWRQILTANATHTLKALDDFERVLARFRAALEAGDGPALAELLAEGKQRRDAVGS
jgi:prephenate dehydrogenase